MRRALDIAKSKLDELRERDPILDAFFEHGAALFQYACLFVVRGNFVCGRRASGVGAPTELVARIEEPIVAPGIFFRACDLRKPFLAPANPSEADEHLFGLLGRAMPQGLVVPLVVKDRVVAIFLGDLPADPIHARSREAGRSAVELTREEMVLWSGWVGEALERLIVRKKNAGSIPPPGFGGIGSIPPPPALPADMFAPAARSAPSMPSAPALAGALEPEEPVQAEVSVIATMRWGSLALGAALLAVAAGGYWLWSSRRDPDTERIVVPASKLPGYPRALEPAVLVASARSFAENGAELASLRVEFEPTMGLDFTKAPPAPGSGVVSLVLVTPDHETYERIDALGVHSPRMAPRAGCGSVPCALAVPAPSCTFAQLRAAAKQAGLLEGERGTVSYADGRGTSGSGFAGPEWLLAVAGRGRARIDPSACALVPGERLLSPAVALDAIPGGPRVDAFALVALAREHAGLGAGAELLEIAVRGMDSNGKLNLAAPEHRVVFLFADPATTSPKERRWREVNVTRDGMPVVSTETDGRPIPSRILGSVDPPVCHADSLYKTVADAAGGGEVQVTYAADTVASRAGAYKVETGMAGVLRRISDAECVDRATLREAPRPAAPPPKRR